MIDYKKIVRSREIRVKISNFLKFIPDRFYLRMVYYLKTGKRLNLKNPKGFNEKLNWLKLNDIHSEYTKLVDKYEVRSVIKDKLGDGYMFPLLGVWNSYDEIDFSSLPNQFVLKCTHDSGSVRIVLDRSGINHKEFNSFYKSRLRINSYNLGREYPYKNVKPRIIAEELMGNGDSPNDYKFFCFDGKPVIMFIATERSSGNTKFDFYDMNFSHLDIVNIHPQSDKGEIAKPRCFEEMKLIAKTCSRGMKFVRIDLYEINGKVYFGEYTFFHGGGFYLFKPDSYELKLGELIKIDSSGI